MATPRLAHSARLRNVSNTLNNAPQKPPPKTPTKAAEGFISSTPGSGKRATPRANLRGRRMPSGTLFSPCYPFTFGLKHQLVREPVTPTSEQQSLSPIQKSLHENVARYGHLAQEFDDYDCEDFDPFQFIASLPQMIETTVCSRLPPKPQGAPPVTLVLDLDETLVHCSTDAGEVRHPDFVFHVEFQGIMYTVHCKKRPGLDEFLEYVKNRFEVVVFTASQRVYADTLLDILDPGNEVINHRMFRDDCTNVEGNYLKDLSVLGRDLRSIVILDNSPQAFAYQVDNGIPILSWFESKYDRELFKVIPLLEQLLDVKDVRILLRERFQLFCKVAAYADFMCNDVIDTFEQRLANSLDVV